MSSNNVSFPAPVGGVPFERDFGPSILFACLFAALVFVAIFRFARSATRTTVVVGTFAFAVERVVIWSLRAKQSKNTSEDLDKNLTIYWQMTFAIGYISMYADIVTLLRCLFVSTTKGITPSQQMLLGSGRNSPEPYASGGNEPGYTLPTEDDKPRLRFWYRRIFGALILASWIPVIIGMIMGYNYVNAETNPQKASIVQDLRYAASAVAFVLILIVQLLSAYALFALPRVRRSAALLALVVTTILNIIPIYHFVIMHNWTKSLVATGPGSQNTNGEKAAFYIFQAALEVLTSGVLLTIDIKNLFSTGFWGDRSSDPKPEDGKV